MKSHSTLPVIREMQMKTTMLLLHILKAIIKNRKYQVLAKRRSNWNPYALLVGIQNSCSCCGKPYDKKLNIELQYDPEIPKKMKAGTPTDIGIPISQQH